MRARLLLAFGVLASLLAAPLSALAFHDASSGEATRDVTFRHKAGNEWWVELVVGGADADRVVAAEARDTDGAWVTLTKRDWGAWAASFHIEPAHEVQFAVLFDDDQHQLSCWFSHPEGVQTRCDSSGGDGGGSGDLAATFEPRNGNEWWVQVKVLANEPLRAVDARVEDGDWVALEHKSWGDWAKSIHAPDGSVVDFRATSTDGDVVVSGQYRWPDGTRVDGGGGDGDDWATFRPKAGNEWWVEVFVDSSKTLAGVDARADAGAWHALAKRSWGAWAGSFHVPDGSLVEFRARARDGSTLVSGAYRWPSATPVDADDGVWPVEGSFAKYEVAFGDGSPTGTPYSWTELNVTMTYRDDRWEATCEGWDYERDYEGRLSKTRVLLKSALSPPREDPSPEVGDEVHVGHPGYCRGSGFHFDYTVTGRATYETKKNGEPVSAPAWTASYEPECNCQGGGASWHDGTGLLFSWSFAGRSSYDHGRLVDTDAPIAPGDAFEPAPAPEGWPHEGSFVDYRTQEWDNSTNYWADVRVAFRYLDGRWTWTCEGERNPGSGNVEPFTYSGEGAPWTGPLRIAEGDGVVVDGGGCYGPREPVVAQGRFAEDATRNGAPHRAEVWWGDEPDGARDRDAWWDTATGLVLRWEARADGDTIGWLVDTDAPLSSL